MAAIVADANNPHSRHVPDSLSITPQHLSPGDAARLRLCCGGAARPAVADLGLHARLGTDYDKFDFLFGGILADWCGFSEGFRHRNSWNPELGTVAPTAMTSACDLAVRLSAYRNVNGVPLSPAMTPADRRTVENMFASSLKRFQLALGKRGT